MYIILRNIHLLTILPCVPIGFYLMVFSKKGKYPHRFFGKIYMITMFFSAMVSLFLEAKVGATFLNHFGWIHLLSVLTVFTVPYSLIAVKKGNIRAHQRSMFFLYWTGLLVAGLFTLSPGRYLNELLFHS